MLTAEQAKRYRTEGYFISPDLLSQAEVEQFVYETERICAGSTVAQHDASRLKMEPGQAPNGTKVRRIHEPCTYYEVFQKFSESPKLIATLEPLLGPDIMYTSSKINVKRAERGSVVEWHQDMVYGPLTPPSVVPILISLDDADLKNGCL